MSKIVNLLKNIGNWATDGYDNATFKPYTGKNLVEGVEFLFHIGSAEGKTLYHDNPDYSPGGFLSSPTWEEMRYLREMLVREGDVIFEVGAHHGCTTVMLSRWVGQSGRVIAFEPNRINFDILRKNIEINRLTNVTIHKLAAGETQDHRKIRGQSILSHGDENTLFTRLSRFYEETATVPLDHFKSLNPTMLKIDIQGYEVFALMGAREILQTRPKLALEIHPLDIRKFGHSLEQLFALLDLQAYRTWILYKSDATAVPFDSELERLNNYPFVNIFALPI